MNCLLYLQYGLHDESVKILPYAVLWIHWLPEYTQVLIWLYWMHHSDILIVLNIFARHSIVKYYSDQDCRAGCYATSFPRTWSLVLLVWFGEEWNTSITKSQRSRAGIPSMRKPASREIISASVEQCETDVLFLHMQLIGTNVWLPNMHKSLPEVDFESSRSPAKSESWNSPNLHCCAVFPTW